MMETAFAYLHKTLRAAERIFRCRKTCIQKLYLPTEEELRRELERERKLVEENRFEGGGE